MSRLALGSAYRLALERLRAWAAHRIDTAVDSNPRFEPSLGQLVSTLLECGERSLADRAIGKLLASQQSDGSWPASAVHCSARETADALRGLLAALPSRPGTRSAIRRACDWCLDPRRSTLPIAYDDGDVAGLAVAASLDAAAEALADGSLSQAARRDHWSGADPRAVHRHQDQLAFLLDLRCLEAVQPLLQAAEQSQQSDGAIPADPQAAWACPTCIAQLAAAWYRAGRRGPADQALAWLLTPQEAASPAEDRSSPAATRELLEAIHSHIAAAFADQVEDFEDHIRRSDGRFGFLLQEAGTLAGQHVLDAGCGRGALARALLTAYPSATLVALDHAPEMLRHVPAAALARCGSIQNLPFEDGCFDVAYCIEALEHAANPEAAVDELCRVVRPGGRVIIVDKNEERKGVLEIEAWERWFDRREVERWLARRCAEVRSTLLVHCPELGPGLFVGWRATRR